MANIVPVSYIVPDPYTVPLVGPYDYPVIDYAPLLPSNVYYPPPPVISTSIQYQDVNKDKNLRKKMTKFFLRKAIKWIESNSEFKHLKKHLKLLKSEDGFEIIYRILRVYIKKYDTHWYDLKSDYSVIKDYMKSKLGNL